jgi:Fe-S-cluster containining protein
MDAQTLPGARWSCRGCGKCCHGFSFGPVEPDIIAGLEAANIAARWPPAAAQPWHTTEIGPDGEPAEYLVSVDGHCIFLQEDQLCAVHRMLGGDRKPWFCREYPFYPVEDDDGRVSVAVRGDCGGLHESFEDGQLITEQLPEILSLPRTVPRVRFDAARVLLLPGIAIPTDAWRQVEPHLLTHLATPRQPIAAIASTRAHLYALASRPVPAPDGVRFKQAMVDLLSALQLGQPDPSPAVERALERWDGTIPLLTEPATRYLMLIVRGALLTRQFGMIGGVPALLGLSLVEAAVAALSADGPGPLGPEALGEAMPGLKRWLRRGERWSILCEQQATLEALFANAPD